VCDFYAQCLHVGHLDTIFSSSIDRRASIYESIVKSGSGGGIVLERGGAVQCVIAYLYHESIMTGRPTNSCISIVSRSSKVFDIIRLINYFCEYTRENGRVCELNLNTELPKRISKLFNARKTGVTLELQ